MLITLGSFKKMGSGSTLKNIATFGAYGKSKAEKEEAEIQELAMQQQQQAFELQKQQLQQQMLQQQQDFEKQMSEMKTQYEERQAQQEAEKQQQIQEINQQQKANVSADSYVRATVKGNTGNLTAGHSSGALTSRKTLQSFGGGNEDLQAKEQWY